MADNIHRNGLHVVHDALARLADNTALLDRALQRNGGKVDELPLPCYSPSNNRGTSILPEIPMLPVPWPDPGPGEERVRLINRQLRLIRLHETSLPSQQFDAQSWCLGVRLAMLRLGESEPQQAFPPQHTNERADLVYEQLPKAEGIMRARWQEQGIWSDEWRNYPPREARWLHEDEESAEPRRPKPRRTRAAEAAAVAAASRPYSQFVYQVAKERDLLLGLVDDLDRPPLPRRKPWLMRTEYPGDPIRSPSAERADDAAYERRRLRGLVPPVPAPLKKAPADVHTTAYETVKAMWVQCRIWDPRWTVLPGLRWMHEEPLDRFVRRHLAEEDGVAWKEAEDEEAEDEDEADKETPESLPVETSRPPPVDTLALFALRPGEDEALRSTIFGRSPTASDGPSPPPASKHLREPEDEEGPARPAKRARAAADSSSTALEDAGAPDENVARSSTGAETTADWASRPS